jgi:hypothetical protein
VTCTTVNCLDVTVLLLDVSQLLLSYWPPCESHHLVNSVQHVFACGLNTSLTVLSSYQTASAVLREGPSLASYHGCHGMIAEPGTRFSAVCTCARCLVAGSAVVHGAGKWV